MAAALQVGLDALLDVRSDDDVVIRPAPNNSGERTTWMLSRTGAPAARRTRDHRPDVSTVDSELVVRLHKAGLVILGKTNTPEFGMAPACEPALFGPARNPWDPRLSTSGSSGGSAAAVASGMVPFAHGNDLGGSLRYPASACGLFALKPTRARNPLGPEYGDVAAGGAAEHALTRSVRDSAALLDATSGPDVGDPYWAPAPARPFLDEVGADPGRLRIGYTTRTPDGGLGHPDCVAAAGHAARLCASLGHDVTEAAWPGFTPEVGAAIGTMIHAATAWILRYWIRRTGREPGPAEIEPLTRALWPAGEKVTAAEWLLAVEDVQRFSRRVARFFTGFDAFLTPTATRPRSSAWPHSWRRHSHGPAAGLPCTRPGRWSPGEPDQGQAS